MVMAFLCAPIVLSHSPSLSRRRALCSRSAALRTHRPARVTPFALAPSHPASPAVPDSSDALDAQLRANTLAVCMVGMSNCGKSHWSSQLAEDCAFSLLSVDDEIEEKLRPILATGGHVGIDGMAEWMGFPSDARFAANQGKYLELEEIVTSAAAIGGDGNYVLDTTGSVVYLSRDVIERIRKRFLVVHLEAGDDMMKDMTDNYFATPKPVVWGDAFTQEEGESAENALRRCYPGLLRERRERYGDMAHVTVPASFALDRKTTTNMFMNRLRKALDDASIFESDRYYSRVAGS